MGHVEKSAEILRKAYEEFGKLAFATSSFQTQGMPLLHLISTVTPEIPIFFLDTGFHFAETLHFKNLLRYRMNLRVIDVVSNLGDMEESRITERWKHDSDGCCGSLKVKVMDSLLYAKANGCWISGVRSEQTRAREGLREREAAPHGITRVHPMLRWTAQDVKEYIEKHSLPRHPLWDKGYDSIGCWPCTVRGSGRSGRWEGQRKDGCGIHNLIERKPCEE